MRESLLSQQNLQEFTQHSCVALIGPNTFNKMTKRLTNTLLLPTNHTPNGMYRVGRNGIQNSRWDTWQQRNNPKFHSLVYWEKNLKAYTLIRHMKSKNKQLRNHEIVFEWTWKLRNQYRRTTYVLQLLCNSCVGMLDVVFWAAAWYFWAASPSWPICKITFCLMQHKVLYIILYQKCFLNST